MNPYNWNLEQNHACLTDRSLEQYINSKECHKLYRKSNCITRLNAFGCMKRNGSNASSSRPSGRETDVYYSVFVNLEKMQIVWTERATEGHALEFWARLLLKHTTFDSNYLKPLRKFFEKHLKRKKQIILHWILLELGCKVRTNRMAYGTNTNLY